MHTVWGIITIHFGGYKYPPIRDRILVVLKRGYIGYIGISYIIHDLMFVIFKAEQKSDAGVKSYVVYTLLLEVNS